MVKNFFKNKSVRAVGEVVLNTFILSILTGLFAGVVVTFYNIFASFGEEYSAQLYTLILQNPWSIPLLFIGLAAGAIVIGSFVKLVPMIRGSGIPQIEGAARGVVKFRWYVTMCSMFAASLACIFMGLPAGAEGPSLEIGGSAGSATATLLRRNQMVKRLQIAAGASSGLAVAFNAPVTGMIFALEEAFHSFSARVFVCSAISVIVAIITRNALRDALNLSVGFAFTSFSFTEMSISGCVYAAIAALVVSLAGVLLYHLVMLAKKLLKKVTFLKGTGKYIIPFVLAGAFGLITAYAMGGGHSFIEALGTNGTGEFNIETIFGSPVVVTLIIVVVIRFIMVVICMGCGVPCGVFIPMLAVGAGLGAILSLAFTAIGMDPTYTDYLIIICMAAFFTTIVRAPITSIVMVFELTGQFTNCLPVLIGVAIGYFVGEMFRIDPIYEKCLDMFVEEEKINTSAKKQRVDVTVMPDSEADGRMVRTLIWPAGGLVVEVVAADGHRFVPDGKTKLNAGDTITFECVAASADDLKEYLYEVVGKPEKVEIMPKNK
ncbi:MAG: ClC family H(+)/Cl(-) exchange transporter [Clostridia bacterium]|nr:ClC family H(+)/Cl(-) exchange transporter [Clostridia bacterium]